MGSQYKYSCSNFNDLRRSIGRMNGGGGGQGEKMSVQGSCYLPQKGSCL